MLVTVENFAARDGPDNPVTKSSAAAGAGTAIPGAYVPDGPKPSPSSLASAAPTTNRSAWNAAQKQPASPKPLPKRPKGKWFVAALLLLFLGGLAVAIWNTFLRYQAYGLVEGRVIQISAPWEGLVRSLEVREGDRVAHGQLLLTIENSRDEAQLARLGDELRIAQAELQAKAVELRLDAQLRGDLHHKAQAEFYEICGTMLQEQSRLMELQAQRKRNEALQQRSAISQAELEAAHRAEEGQRGKVEKLKSAAAEMEQRVKLISQQAGPQSDELGPKLIRIEAIQAEIMRLRRQMELGQIRAPVGGRLIRRLRFTGERVDAGEPVLELLEDDSLRIVIYLPQSKSDLLELGQACRVYVDAMGTTVDCTVERIGDRLEPAPPPLARYHAAGEPLLPVYLRPDGGGPSGAALRLGSVVTLARNWPLKVDQ